MRSNYNADTVRRIKLVGYVGKNLVATIENNDSARDPKDLSAFTGWARVLDEDGTVMATLSPTINGAAGEFILDEATPAIAAGWYRWEGGLVDSAGELLYEGPIEIHTY